MIYYKKGKVIVIGHVLNQFIYELSVNVFHKNYYFVANTKYFSSLINLPVVESYKVNKNIEISCYLHAAPIDWLINNDFVVYSRQIKKRKKKNESEIKIT